MAVIPIRVVLCLVDEGEYGSTHRLDVPEGEAVGMMLAREFPKYVGAEYVVGLNGVPCGGGELLKSGDRVGICPAAFRA